MAALRAAAETPSPGGSSSGTAKFRELAADCAARLRARLDRPQRRPDDWSITLPPGGCTCDLCADLRDFLAAPDERTFEWPLAKPGRQHVHSRIDAAEIPVTHVTRRQGRPYTLVLSKTDDLFTAEHQSRAEADENLRWLARTWDSPA